MCSKGEQRVSQAVILLLNTVFSLIHAGHSKVNLKVNRMFNSALKGKYEVCASFEYPVQS